MRFSFTKAERLWGHNALENLYQKGKSFQTVYFKIIYLSAERSEDIPCRIAFSAPKKSFKKAVTRNLLKRRMKEAYRLQKHNLYKHLIEKQTNIDVFVIYLPKKEHDYNEIYSGMTAALQTLQEKIT